MSVKKSRKVIEGREYSMICMPPSRAVGFGLRVSAVLATALQSTDFSDLLKDAADPDKMVNRLAPIIASMDADKVENLISEAFSYEVYANNSKLSDQVHYNNWFTEHPEDLYPVAMWAVWEHSKDFLRGIAGASLPSDKADKG